MASSTAWSQLTTPSIHLSWKNMDHHHYTSYVVLSYLIGCEYGDKSTACSAIEARQCYDPFNEDLCCGSCGTFYTGYPGKDGLQWTVYFIEAEWRIYFSVNKDIIGSDKSLSPDWRQAIIWTNAGTLPITPLGTNFSKTINEIHIFHTKKIHLKN